MPGQDEQDEQDSSWAGSQVFEPILFDAGGVGRGDFGNQALHPEAY